MCIHFRDKVGPLHSRTLLKRETAGLLTLLLRGLPARDDANRAKFDGLDL